METPLKNAYAYLRVSGKAQVSGHGLQRQAEAVRAYAKAHGCQIVQTFQDRGVSGTDDLQHRPGLGALMLAVESDGVRTVLIEKLDRLARDLVVQEILVADMARHGVKLVSAAEGPGLASDDPSRKLIRQIMGAVAEYDKTMLTLKLRAARDAQRARKGKCEGRKAYGEVDPREREAVGRMRQLRRKRPSLPRMGYRRIAQVLQREGYPTRNGGPWRSSTVAGIINGPIYARLGRRRASG